MSDVVQDQRTGVQRMVNGRRRYTHAEWLAEGERLHPGLKPRHWRFRCPSCQTVFCGQDFVDGGVPEATVREQQMFLNCCIGRYVPGKGCDWALFGLLQIHNAEVETESGAVVPVMEFAEVAL